MTKSCKHTENSRVAFAIHSQCPICQGKQILTQLRLLEQAAKTMRAMLESLPSFGYYPGLSEIEEYLEQTK